MSKLTRLDCCQYLLSTPINYKLTQVAVYVKSSLILVAMINKKSFNAKPAVVPVWIDLGNNYSHSSFYPHRRRLVRVNQSDNIAILRHRGIPRGKESFNNMPVFSGHQMCLQSIEVS